MCSTPIKKRSDDDNKESNGCIANAHENVRSYDNVSFSTNDNGIEIGDTEAKNQNGAVAETKVDVDAFRVVSFSSFVPYGHLKGKVNH